MLLLAVSLLPTVLAYTTSVNDNKEAKNALAAMDNNHTDAVVHADQVIGDPFSVTCFVCQGANDLPWGSQARCGDSYSSGCYNDDPSISVNFTFTTDDQVFWSPSSSSLSCRERADQMGIAYNGSMCISWTTSRPPPPSLPPSPPTYPPPSPPTSEDSSCFSAATTTACRLLTPTASPLAAYKSCYATADREHKQLAAERVMLASLNAGDRVLTADSASGALALTHILVNQHASAADSDPATSPLLRLHTSDGAVLTLTPDHALYVNGVLAAVRDVVVGSVLTTTHATTTTVTHVTPLSRGPVVNPTTASGTILASDHGEPLLAASHPIWIAPLLLSSPTARIVANVALSLAGDAASKATFAAVVLAKIGGTIAILRFAGTAVARRKFSVSA